MKTFSESFRKNLLACLIGPLAVIPASIVYALAFKILAPEANVDNFELLPLFVLAGLVIAYPSTLLIGLPVSLFLQKIGKFKFAILNGLVFVVVTTLALMTSGAMNEYILYLYFSLCVASACWYMYRIG